MLARHILGYIPSLVIPALMSFAAVYFFTRLLSQAEFGYYTLSINVMTLMNAVCYYWLQISMSRLMPQAVRESRERQLRATIYLSFLGVTAVVAVVAPLVLIFAPLGNLQEVVQLAVPLAIVRSLLSLNQALHRNEHRISRYNMIECGQAVASFVISLALVYFGHLGNRGAVMGMILGLTAMALLDLRVFRGLDLKEFDRKLFREVVHFGYPFVISFGLGFVCSTSDRFLIEHFQGAAQVGLYAAGYTLVDRINTILFMMVVTPSYPLTIQKLEHEGVEAARDQTYQNGVAMLLMAVPACVGLAMTDHYLVNVLIGEKFREGALKVIPWIVCATFLNGLTTHYFDHAFHLAKKSHRFFFTLGPTAAFSLIANLYLIPRYGYMGAAYSAVATYALLMTLSVSLGRSVFRIKFPFRPALEIAGAAALMALVLHRVHLPETVPGLIGMIILGATVYGAAILALDVMGAQKKVRKYIAKILPKL